MVVDAKSKFIDRMAMTIHAVKFDETLAGMSARFAGHSKEDITEAHARSKHIHDDTSLRPPK